ncbi:MAG: redoxin domain-containing protein [Spirochaetia bacterium]|nr:redoxin domain-containing protein [Spirochaetia bacterium]
MKISRFVPAFLLLTTFLVACGGPKAENSAITVGSAAPEFTLNSQDSKPISLRDLRGKWVVLYFYPKDFSGGCTLQAHNFQRDLAQYESKNAMIVGVSGQDEKSHLEFCSKEGLNFKLLADTNFDVSKLYGSLRNLGVIKLSARNTFLIDPKGIVRKIFMDVKPALNSEEVLNALKELQS